MGNDLGVNLGLHPKQMMALESVANELFYGGAAGGGKSHLIRVVAILYASMIPGCQIYLFRKVLPDLLKTHVEGSGGFRELLAPWIIDGRVQIVGEEVRFWNSSKIYLCHCQDDSDRFKYLSADIHVLLVDELTTFNEIVYRFLRSRVRAAGIEKPKDFKYPFPRIIAGSNPSGVGHSWVRRTFVSPAKPMEVWSAPRDEGGMTRQYIPALLEDNPSIDEGYESRLMGLGSEALVNAYRYGFWDQVEGAFFDCFGPKNVIHPMPLPDWWNRSMSFDWGRYDPFSTGWYSVVGKEGYQARDARGVQIELPSGAGILYRGWYGADKQGKGLKMEPHAIAQGFKARENGERLSYRVTGKDCFAHRSGPSIAELFGQQGIYFRPGDNSRIPGWLEMHRRFVGDERGPLLYFFSSCRDEIEQIPLMQHDEHNPEDAAQGNDHCLIGETLVDTTEGQVPIRDFAYLANNPFVWNARGRRVEVTGARLTRKAAEVYKMTLEDGRCVTATPDHRFQDELGRWRELRMFRPHDKVRCLEPNLFVRNAHARQHHLRYLPRIQWNQLLQMRVLFQQTGQKAFSWLKKAAQGCLGLPQWAYPEGTPRSPLRRQYPKQSGGKLGFDSSFGTPKPSHADTGTKGADNSPKQEEIQGVLRSGEYLEKNAGGQSFHGRSRKENLRQYAESGEGLWAMWQSLLSFFSTQIKAKVLLQQMQTKVLHIEIKSIERTRASDVYCLTVPDGHSYTIEGGIISHNCGEQTRLWCMSRPLGTAAPKDPTDKIVPTMPTYNDLWAEHGRMRKRKMSYR